MLVFRKWFLALALVTLTVAVASAQPAFQCVANAGVPPIVRAEGIAELTGDLVLNCNNGIPTATGLNVPQVNIQIFLNANITSKIDSDDKSEALLMLDEPGPTEQTVCPASKDRDPGGCAVKAWPDILLTGSVYEPALLYKPTRADGEKPYNVFQGRKGGANSIVWLGVPVDAPGTQFTRIIRVTNVRAGANSLGVSSTLVPNQIIAYISITGSTSVPINNPQQTVAWIQTGLSFKVKNLAGDDDPKVKLLQCTDTALDTYKDPNKTDKYCYTGRLRFEEGFATAWKTRFAVSGPGPYSASDYQNYPGRIYNSSESGFWTADATIANWPQQLSSPAGMASQGTRLRVVFNGIPAGVRLYVSINNIPAGSTNKADLVNVSTIDGSGAYAIIPGTGSTANEHGATGDPCTDWKEVTYKYNEKVAGEYKNPFAEVTIFGGTGYATWEVTMTDYLAIQRMEFGYMVAYAANTANNLPGVGSATINGMFAPTSTTVTMSSAAPVPRFADTSSAKTVFTIDPCATNLLFPFVSNQAGFDTGLVISNTTKDPWAHATESGTCKLSYYGNTNGGAAPPAQTSAAIPAGEHLIWGLSSGGTFGVTATQGFQGYIIAQCKFRFAHGFAFISDYGNTKTAHGYLALVMDKAITRDDVSSSENLGQ